MDTRHWSNTIDVWTKIISTLAGILIPVAIWLVGEEIKSVERAVSLITHLSSESVVERKLALRVVKQLAAGGQLTPDLAGSLVAVIVDDTDQEVRDLALEIANSNPEFWGAVAVEAEEELAKNAEQAPTAQQSLLAFETLQQIQATTPSAVKIEKKLAPRLYSPICVPRESYPLQPRRSAPRRHPGGLQKTATIWRPVAGRPSQ